MKNFIVLLCMLLPLGAFSQELKFAYVNASEVFNLMPEVAVAETQYAKVSEQYSNDYKAIEDEYTVKFQEYMKIQETLTENLKLRRQQELQDLQERLNNFVPFAQQSLEQERATLYSPIEDKLRNAIKAVGEEQGYTYIIDNNPQVMYYVGNAAINATPFVKAKLGIK